MKEILITEKVGDYELLDSGGEEKLERYGSFVLSRPDPQAVWQKTKAEEWQKADAVFERVGATGKWNLKKEIPETWKVSLDNIIFNLKLLPSKHVGVFPEQLQQWKWLEEKIHSRVSKAQATKVQVLNLFAYTGGASLFCAKAGAEVCHVDSSDFAVDLAGQNAKDSNISNIRFIVDDVRKFVEREIKRGNKYDVIILDPPVYGKGGKGKTWKIEKDLAPLLIRLKEVLSSEPLALVLNGYASVYSSTTYERMLTNLVDDLGGQVSSGELNIKESSSGKLLPCGIFARWSK